MTRSEVAKAQPLPPPPAGHGPESCTTRLSPASPNPVPWAQAHGWRQPLPQHTRFQVCKRSLPRGAQTGGGSVGGRATSNPIPRDGVVETAPLCAGVGGRGGPGDRGRGRAVSPCGPGSNEEGPGVASAFPGAWGTFASVFLGSGGCGGGCGLGLGRRRLPGKRLAFQARCCPSPGMGSGLWALGRPAPSISGGDGAEGGGELPPLKAQEARPIS